MPKILENVRERILAEAQRQITENGYGKTTIRSVAGACGLGVGTVYNYFKYKDMLIASFMLEDWQEALGEMKAYPSEDPKTVLYGIYTALRRFSRKHQALFTDADAAKVFASVFSQRHGQLRTQIADVIRPLCDKAQDADKAQNADKAQDADKGCGGGAEPLPEFLPDFAAEAMLTWTMAGKSFEELYSVLGRLF